MFYLVPNITHNPGTMGNGQQHRELCKEGGGSVSKTPSYVCLAAALGSLSHPKSLEITQEEEGD